MTNVVVSDTGCVPVNGPSGDINANIALENTEVWTYSCAAIVMTATTNTATAQGDSGGLRHTSTTLTTIPVSSAGVPAAGIGPENISYTWVIFAAIMVASGLFLGFSLRRGL